MSGARSYRPITDYWLLARSRNGFYGGYPYGFLERARALLGVTINDPVLHVCAGAIRHYPYRGLGKADKTLDLDPANSPDFLQDARDPWPAGFKAILADPDYTDEDADHRPMGRDTRPSCEAILKRAAEVLHQGHRIGLLHYLAPMPKARCWRCVALIAVLPGFNVRIRNYTVFERL